jgi:hypothetical protein
MNDKLMFKEELDKNNVFSGKLPEILIQLAGSINNYRIPYRMKLAIAVSEFILFFSQFQKKIKLYDGALIPINSITFCIAGSGAGKDSSKDAVRTCFGEAYQVINETRKTNAKNIAIEAARKEGKDNPTEFDVWKEYYSHPSSLFSAPNSTLEGLTSDFNRLEDEGLGAGFVYSGEIGDEFGNGIDLLMQFMAEVYDKGSKEVKALKGKESQLKPLYNFPVSALFMGSQAGILFEQDIKHKFRKAFNSKLARRSYFMYAPDEEKRPDFGGNIAKFDKWTAQCKSDAYDNRTKAIASINTIVPALINGSTEPLTLAPEVQKIYDRYTAYNEEVAESEIEHQYPISKLVRKHLQWKALKFAGAIAMFHGRDIISISDYVSAVTYCEQLNRDMELFEAELAKQPHEVFADYMNVNCGTDGKSHMSFHTIKKLGYISSTGTTEARVHELVKLAASYDKTGIYTVCDEGVCFERQQLTDIINISYLPIDNTELFKALARNASKDELDDIKRRIANQTTYGYEHYDTTFAELADMLQGDFAYTPFKLRDSNDKLAKYDKEKHKNAKGGVRGKDNIVGGCKWVVLDVDDSTLTAEEVDFMLSDINHHISLTSNGANHKKFRILLELDSIVDIPDIQWKHFIGLISEHIAIKADPLPKAQIFFSYADRQIWSMVDAEPLPAKNFIIDSAELVAKKERVKKEINPAQKKAALNDPLTTFHYAYEAADGEGSRSLIRAALHAKDLGADQETVTQLMHDINDYWAYSMPEERFGRTILTYVERLF